MCPVIIKKGDLEDAFDNSYGEWTSYLDTETGRVIMVGHDHLFYIIDDILEADASLAEVVEPIYDAMFDEELEDPPDVNLSRLIEDELNKRERYCYIEPEGSHEGYRDMTLFARSVEDDDLRQALLIALDGRGAFRRFKDVLLGYPDQREAWFAFKDERVTKRLRYWCESIGVDAIFV